MISIIVLPAGYFHTKESTETKLSTSMGPHLIYAGLLIQLI